MEHRGILPCKGVDRGVHAWLGDFGGLRGVLEMGRI